MPKDKKDKKEDIPEEESAAVNEPEAVEAEVVETPPEENMVPESALRAEADKFLRLAAEFDNFKKRSHKEREALYIDVKCDTISKLLPVYDNLARALKQDTSDEAFKKGIEMTMTQLESIFDKMGVKAIEAVGKTFDPAVHNAVMHVDDAERGENEIVEEFEKGFMLGEKVIRFSAVKVAN